MAETLIDFQSDQEDINDGECTTTKPRYSHVPHHLRPPEVVAKRNARERRRVETVNNAFSRLRQRLPSVNRNKRLSKAKTLQKAIDYIQHLQGILEAYSGQPLTDTQAPHTRHISALSDHTIQNCVTNSQQQVTVPHPGSQVLETMNLDTPCWRSQQSIPDTAGQDFLYTTVHNTNDFVFHMEQDILGSQVQNAVSNQVPCLLQHNY